MKQKSRILLALDSSTGVGSVGLAIDGTIALQSLDTPHSQAAGLIPAIESLLQQAEIGYTDITDLAVTIGPGSFTGIRIALSVARTIAYAHPDIRIHPLTTLESMAAGYMSEHTDVQNMVTLLKAGRGEVYAQPFVKTHNRLTSPEEIQIMAPEALAERYAGYEPWAGNVAIDDAHCAEASLLPSAQGLIAAVDLYETENGNRRLSPLYIRPPDAKLPSKSPL